MNEDIETTGEEVKAAEKAEKKATKPKNGLGASIPQRFERQGTNEADLIWNQLCEWLPTSQDPALPTRSPYDIMIQVRRVYPPHPSGEAQPIGRSFSGSAVMGGPNSLPGNELINYVMRYFHLPTTDQPASYEIYFFKKGTGGQITVGRMPMPSGSECRAALQASQQAVQAEGGGPGLGWPQGMGAPQQQLVAPWWAQQPPPYYQPPPAPASVDHNQLAYLTGALQEALAAAREGRQPNIAPPPGLGTPAPAPAPALDEDRIVAKVLMALQKAGVTPAPAPVLAPAAPVALAPIVAAPATASGLGAMMEKAILGMAENLMKTAVGAMEKNVRQTMGMGAPPPEAAEEVDDEPAKPENPADLVPWKIAPVGAEWGNKSPVQVAINKETGDIDPVGLAFANPAVAEKVIDTLNGLGHALQDAIKRVGQGAMHRPPPAAPQIGVAAPIPAMPMPPMPAAISAAPVTGGGGGWGPPPVPPPPPPPPPAPPAPVQT